MSDQSSSQTLSSPTEGQTLLTTGTGSGLQSSVSTTPIMPWWVLPGLALIVLIIFAVALVASCYLKNDTLLTQMFTATVSLAMTAMGYFFGSSVGSAKKDNTIATLQPPPPLPPQPTPQVQRSSP